MKNKVFSSIMALGLVVAMAIPVCAASISTDGGSQSVPVELTVTTATFSVTVPTALPITVNGDGSVTTADNVYIENNSHGAVKVTGMTIEGVGDWVVCNFDTTDMTKEKAGAKKIAMSINGDKTTADDTITFTPSNFPKMDGKNDTDSDKLKITYQAKLPAQVVELDKEVIANVVFVVGWDS